LLPARFFADSHFELLRAVHPMTDRMRQKLHSLSEELNSEHPPFVNDLRERIEDLQDDMADFTEFLRPRTRMGPEDDVPAFLRTPEMVEARKNARAMVARLLNQRRRRPTHEMWFFWLHFFLEHLDWYRQGKAWRVRG